MVTTPTTHADFATQTLGQLNELGDHAPPDSIRDILTQGKTLCHDIRCHNCCCPIEGLYDLLLDEVRFGTEVDLIIIIAETAIKTCTEAADPYKVLFTKAVPFILD